jgi:RNA polymerase sigma-70 factor (ECF subfamily)
MEGTLVLESSEAVARMRSGDPDAFAEVVESDKTLIVRYLYRLTGDHETARDLAQDTFVQAYKAIPRTSPDLSLKPWLYRIATNNALQHRRRKRLLSFVPFGDDSKDESLKGPGVDLAESAAVQEALLKVPEKLRVCMVLHHIDGFKYREIAGMLGISEDASRMRVARGSEEFRRRYAAEGDER